MFFTFMMITYLINYYVSSESLQDSRVVQKKKDNIKMW